MSEKRIKHLTALAVWAIIQGYFLALHFSWGNAIVMAVGLVLLALSMLFGEHVDKLNVKDDLLKLLRITFLVFLGYFVVSHIVPMYTDKENALELLLTNFGAGVEYFFDRVEFSPLTLFLLVLFFITGRSKKHPLLNMLSKYLFWAVLMIACFKVWCDAVSITVLVLLSTLIFATCDIYDYLCCNIYTKDCKRWYRVLTFLLLLVLMLKPDALLPYAQPGYMEKYFVIDGFKWYTALLLFALFAGAAYIMWRMDREDGVIGIGNDAYLFLIAACLVVAAFFMTRFFVGYWWVLAILYSIGIGYALVALHPKKTADYLSKRKRTYLFVPVLTVLLVVLTIAGHNGRLMRMSMLLATAAGVAWLWKHTDFSTDTWKDKAWFYTGLMLAVALNVLVTLYCFRRITFNFLLLLGIFAVCAAFVWFLSMQSGLLSRKSYFARAAVVAVFVILCLSLCGTGGSKIELQTGDPLLPAVTVTARGKDNQVQAVEYYWWASAAAPDETQEDFPEEIQIDGTLIPNTDGRLRVVALDSMGIKTEQIYWIHNCKYVESGDSVENDENVQSVESETTGDIPS